MANVMGFIGHTGRSAGSYISFHTGMARRARQVQCLPSTFLKKEGLRRMLAKIGGMVMTAAAGRDATMLLEAVGIAHIRSPFFPTGSLPCEELALFDKDLEEARSKARLHQDYGDDEGGNFRTRESWYSDDWRDSKRTRAETYPGCKLEKFSVYLTKHGLLFGCKFLVTIGGDDTIVPHDTCVCRLSYSTSEDRRAEWCNKGCADHKRPSGMEEGLFRVINIYAEDNSDDHAAIAKEVIDAQSSWQHWAGPKSFDIMGGKGGKASVPLDARRDRSPGGGGPSGGKGKGKGNGGGGKGKGKGKGGGKGKGKGGGRDYHFGRQH